MKAIVQDKYGSPGALELRDVDRPAPKDDEVLVRVRAASVHPDVWHVVRGVPYILRLMGSGLLRPNCRIPGTDMAGQVESVGKNVVQFRPGDEVFGECLTGHQWVNGGAYAEYVSVRESALAQKPANVTFEQAAAVPTSGFIALQGLRTEGGIQAGHKVLINGAGGGVGSLAVQLARAYGADVTGVENTRKLDLVRSLGADQVIDCTQEDFTRGGERYDLIIDVASNLSLADGMRALTPEGTYVLIGHDHFGKLGHRWLGSIPRMLKRAVLSRFVRQLRNLRPATDTRAPLVVLKELLEAGKLAPIIDRTFPLSEVPEAICYLQDGHAKGKVVITM